MNKKKKTILVYILSFGIPVLLMMAIFQSIGISYNGKLTLLGFDLKAQYAPFISQLRYLLKDPGSLLFNLNNSFGGNYLGVFAYYMASPLNLITLLWKPEHMAQAIYVLTLLKIGLCGVTFQTFLQSVEKEHEPRFANVFFAICYALMSFNVVYGMSIMWLDAVILLPIVLLGVEQILKGKKGGVFFLSILLCFISNYYMSYMVGIFAFFYFVAGLINQKEPGKKVLLQKCTRFFMATILALFIAAPLLLPAILNVKNRYEGDTIHLNLDVAYRFRITDLLVKFMPSHYDSVYSEGGRPYIFCGVVILALTILYFVQKRSLREKITSAVLLLAVFAGFLFREVDYIWHGFRYPNGFPYRYAFLFSACMLILAHRAWVTLNWKEKAQNGICLIAAAYTCMELFLNGSALVAGIYKEVLYDTANENRIQNELYAPLAAKIRETDEFYRMGSSEKYVGFNVESMYGLNATDYFSSDHNSNIKTFMRLMGGASDYVGMTMTSRGFTPLVDSLCGIRYRIGEKNPAGLYQERLTTSSHDRLLSLWENPDALSIGFMAGDLSGKKTPEFSTDPFGNQWLFMDYLGVENSRIFYQVPYGANVETAGNVTKVAIQFSNPGDFSMYGYFDAMTDMGGSVKFALDGKEFSEVGQLEIKKVFELPEMKTDTEHVLTITGPLYNINGFYLCAFDKEAYKEEISVLKDGEMKNVRIKGNKIQGNISVQKAGTLFTTIPYEEGFAILVDGKKVSYEKVLDTFIGISLTEGSHDIEITFIPNGLLIGICLFFVGVLGSGLWFFVKKCKEKNKNL